MNKHPRHSTLWLIVFGFLLAAALAARAALLAYEPFTNAPGTAIIGSAGGFGFSGAWQANSSGGVATNTAYALNYTDRSTNTLIVRGGAGFFQGLTSANTSMQPIRLFASRRGTNGTDGVTTWISFLAVRQGPVVAGNNPYPRGANVPHDINSGSLQKLAIGNSSDAASNTVGLIPQGNGANLKPSTIAFSVTNFIVVRINHAAGAANDAAYLFVNPDLGAEPALSAADTNSVGAFDFSFDRLRVFAGGNASASQPYAELVVDEYRLGEAYADVTPHTTVSNPPAGGDLTFTNAVLTAGGIALSGTGGASGTAYRVLASPEVGVPVATWPAVATNNFDASGNFAVTSAIPTGAVAQFYRLQIAPPAPVIAPSIVADPTNQTVVAGLNASFSVAADGTEPLSYQWYYNTNTVLPGRTDATLTLSNVQSTNAGTYSARVSNAAGDATSAPALLIVLSPPAITTQPADQSVVAGDNATFTVTAAGSGTLHYQWYFNTNTPLANATSATFTVTNAQATNAAGYSVIITNLYGAVTSAIARLTVSDTVITNGSFFVSPAGSDSNPGTIDRPFLTISKGLTAVGNGGRVYLRGGTYSQPSKLSLSKIASPTNRICLWAYPGEKPIIDNSGIASGTDGFSISGNAYYFRGLEQMKATHNGIRISGNSNIIERCVIHDNGNTGLHISGGQSGTDYPSNNLVLNCDAYRNYDPPVGENADGFSAKWQIGPGNVFRGCRAYTNSDDGWDLWMGTSTVVLEDCWAFANGVDVWFSGSFDGNGNGIKLGGNYVATPHIAKNCISFNNVGGPTGSGRGFDENNNTAGQTLYNCTAYNNRGNNFHMQNTVTNGQHIVRNCISYAGNVNITSGTRDHNSWQGFTVTGADFLSLDTTQASAPRNPDGSLPSIGLLHLAPGSAMIDAGIDVGLPYNGSAPDLGAFETGP